MYLFSRGSQAVGDALFEQTYNEVKRWENLGSKAPNS